jgi:hypothetical protein
MGNFCSPLQVLCVERRIPGAVKIGNHGDPANAKSQNSKSENLESMQKTA